MTVVRRLGIAVGGIVALFVAVGALHAPAARPWLLALSGGGCPIGEPISPEAAEAARRQALSARLGDGPAPALDLAGPALGQDRAVAEAWTRSHDLACADEGSVLACRSSDGRMELRFDPSRRLVSVEHTWTEAAPGDAAARFVKRTEQAALRAGTPTSSRGEATGMFLGKGPLSQAAASFRFSDYRVELTATNLGRGRFVVRETHQVL